METRRKFEKVACSKLTTERLISNANHLKNQYYTIISTINKDALLKTQYDLFLHAGLAVTNTDMVTDEKYGFATPEFKAILNEFMMIGVDYQKLKMDVIENGLMEENDLNVLEAQELKKFEFHPLFQKAYDDKKNALTAAHENIVAAIKVKQDAQAATWNRHKTFYQNALFYTGIASIVTAGAGLPLCLGFLVAELVDAIVNKVKQNQLQKKIDVDESETNIKVKKATADFYAEMLDEPSNHIKNSMFNLCKMRQSLNFDNCMMQEKQETVLSKKP